jgi:hypothetical protein
MLTLKKKCSGKSIILLVAIILLANVLNILIPGTAAAEPSKSLEIFGDGVKQPTLFTLEQLQEMEQVQKVYSAINTWPTKKWYVGEGVNLRSLLDSVGMSEEARMIRFYSNDGYSLTLTIKELFEDQRYCFPHFMDNSSSDGGGNILGSSEGAEPVEAIIALKSVEGSNNPKYMNDLNSLLLMLGQRAVSEQTGNLFVKYLDRIEVLREEPPQWDSPQTNPEPGAVEPGTMVTLSNANMDDDKIYYTTDGSVPTVNSNMYNWIARRWWSARSDVLGLYNKPIGPINEDITIKAITIGPGKRDSEVVTFSYTILSPESDEGKPAVSLNDIKGHWAQQSIEELVARGGVGGYPDGSFKPGNTVTRAEFAVMLVKTLQLEKGDKVFSDTIDHWAKDEIAAASSRGIVNGYDADTFGPDDLITREQMALMIFKAAGLTAQGEETGFADKEDISSWAKEAVAAVVAERIMNGYQDNTIRPQGKASRAEAATVIIKILNR